MAWLNDGGIQGLVLGSGGVLVWALALYVASRAPSGRTPADTAIGLRHTPPGPLLPIYQAFVLVCLVWPAANLLLLWRSSPPGSPLRARWAWLSASAVVFLMGGGWIVIASGVYRLVG